MLQPLLANLAVVAMMLIAWNGLAATLSRLPQTVRDLLFGLSMAVGALASMEMSFQVAPGMFFDLRNPLIVISGLFGGLPAAAITAGCALIFRVFMGGAVALGVIGILVSVAIGLLAHMLRRNGSVSAVGLAAVAAGSSVTAPLIITLFAGNEPRIALPDIAVHSFVSCIAVLLLGAVLLWEGQRRRLAEVNAQFRAMVDALPDCLNLKDVEGRFIAANPATAAMMQVAGPADLIGRTDADFYPAALAASFREDECAVLAGGKATVIEQKGFRPDGAESWLATLKAPAFDRDGRIVGLVTSNRDITVRKALQDKLTETQAYLDQALKNMNDGLAIYDGEARLLFCNVQYRNLFPATAHLRVPGVDLMSIISASVAAGEEIVPAGMSLAAHAEMRRCDLFRNGEYLIHKPGGAVYAARTTVLDNGNALRVISDVTERFNYERTLEHQALHDALTGLPNRAYFSRELDRLLAKAQADKEELVVMLLDLDKFKQVNDSFGHAAGDALLVEVSRRLAATARRGDFVARLGGDEFAVLLPGDTKGTGDVSLATRISKALSRPMTFGDVTLLPGATIGYTIWPSDPSGREGLLRNADKALYQAKARGRGTWKVYAPEAGPSAGQARA